MIIYDNGEKFNLSENIIFNKFEPRQKSAKNRFQLSAGLNLKIINTILSGTFEAWLKFKPLLKFFKFSLGIIKVNKNCQN